MTKPWATASLRASSASARRFVLCLGLSGAAHTLLVSQLLSRARTIPELERPQLAYTVVLAPEVRPVPAAAPPPPEATAPEALPREPEVVDTRPEVIEPRFAETEAVAVTAAEAPPDTNYWMEVRARIGQHLHPPRGLRGEALVLVDLRLSESGELLHAEIVGGDAVESLQRRVLRAVTLASPFPPPPSPREVDSAARLPVRFRDLTQPREVSK